MAADEDKDSKTEEATPRRLDEARDKGQVAMSTEFVAAIGLAVGVAMLALASKPLGDAVGLLLVNTIGDLGPGGKAQMGPNEAAAVLKHALLSVSGAIAIVLSPAIVMGGLAAYGQAGFRIAPEAVKVDITKLDVIKGAQRLFSMKGVVRTVLALSKVVLIGAVVSAIAWAHVEEISRVGNSELGPLLIALSTVGFRCAAGALVVILVLSIVDLVYQRWQHARDMRMSKQETKEERKMTDGDPQVKARIRQLQREAAFGRMMDDVPDATVVVTNPTHYAVALKYDRSGIQQTAPICVAKGVDSMAQRIKEVAAEAGVTLHEDVPLARALHAKVNVGEEIPEELFAAVAAVLSQVYRMQGEAVAA